MQLNGDERWEGGVVDDAGGDGRCRWSLQLSSVSDSRRTAGQRQSSEADGCPPSDSLSPTNSTLPHSPQSHKRSATLQPSNQRSAHLKAPFNPSNPPVEFTRPARDLVSHPVRHLPCSSSHSTSSPGVYVYGCSDTARPAGAKQRLSSVRAESIMECKVQLYAGRGGEED